VLGGFSTKAKTPSGVFESRSLVLRIVQVSRLIERRGLIERASLPTPAIPPGLGRFNKRLLTARPTPGPEPLANRSIKLIAPTHQVAVARLV
jgi:hypothetical protein